MASVPSLELFNILYWTKNIPNRSKPQMANRTGPKLANSSCHESFHGVIPSETNDPLGEKLLEPGSRCEKTTRAAAE